MVNTVKKEFEKGNRQGRQFYCLEIWGSESNVIKLYLILSIEVYIISL